MRSNFACMRSNFASVINSILEFRNEMHAFLCFKLYHSVVLARDSSYMSGDISSPFFRAKNVSVTAYLLRIFCLLFYNH